MQEKDGVTACDEVRKAELRVIPRHWIARREVNSDTRESSFGPMRRSALESKLKQENYSYLKKNQPLCGT